MRVTVLVIGSNGQDGSILCDLLDADNQTYIAVSRNETRFPDKATRGPVDLSIPKEATIFLDEFKPSAIVHLAAVHVLPVQSGLCLASVFHAPEHYRCGAARAALCITQYLDLLDDAVRLEHTHDVDFGGLGIKIFNGKAGRNFHAQTLLAAVLESQAHAIL